jgi:hypothetical protein
MRPPAATNTRDVLGEAHQHADTSHPIGLLRADGERPCERRAAEESDELAPLHRLLTQ